MPLTNLTSLTHAEIFTQKSEYQASFSSAQRTFPRIDCILGHKTNLNNVPRVEII